MKRLQASYTIEAAYVMAVVLMALASMILAAYNLHDKTAGAMAVQEAVEQEVYLERDWKAIRKDEVKTVYLKDGYRIKTQIERGNVQGKGEGENWTLNIQRKTYEPEGFLRLMSMIQEGLSVKEDEKGDE